METFMATCPKCGSSTSIDGASITVPGRGDVRERGLTATVYKKPTALVFRGAVTRTLTARICGQCGYVEFFVEDPSGLMAAVERDGHAHGS
jgi:predicted nucleic-acid-binding Zn-ribbon protein